MGHVWAQLWPAVVIGIGGCVALALWRGGSRLLEALVEIARLPGLVESLLDEIRGLVARVGALEDLIPESLRVRADLTIDNRS
jgi:hypothetical protein